MDKRFELTVLMDFYAPLLTEHRRQILSLRLEADLTFQEIADQLGISRQGVHDLVKRCDRLLLDYEEKLHLLERFQRIKGKIWQIHRLTFTDGQDSQETVRSSIRQLSNEILEEL